jgi:hypothetical protein
LFKEEGGESEVVGALMDFSDVLEEVGIFGLGFKEGLQNLDCCLVLSAGLKRKGSLDLLLAGSFWIGTSAESDEGRQKEGRESLMDAVGCYIFHGRHHEFILWNGYEESIS